MDTQLLRCDVLKSSVKQGFAVALKRPTGRTVASGIYEVKKARRQPDRTIVTLHQPLDEATQQAVIRQLGSRLRGKTVIRVVLTT